MNVGILGSGDVAQALALGFLDDGDAVMLASREPAKLAAFTKRHQQASAGTLDEAAAFGDVLVLPVTGLHAVDVVRALDPRHLAGKVVIDTTLPTTDDADARDVVRGICIRFGWEVADLGAARAARFVEPLAGLWCIPYYRDGRTSQTFRLLT